MIKRMMAILAAVTILCAAVLTSVSASNPFADVAEGEWYYNDVEYVRENNLMSGTSESEFSPKGTTTRGMIVTVLWRLEGEPKETGKDFEDVNAGDWYYDAVAWASNNGIVSGYSETTFGPKDNATREQLASIVYRYATYKKYDVSKTVELDKYADKDQISGYAETSIKWANAVGLINGTSDSTLSPTANVERAQLAAILKRFCVNIVDGAQPEEPKEEDPKTEEPKEEDPKEEDPKTEEPKDEGNNNEKPSTGENTTDDPEVNGDTGNENDKPADVDTPSDTSKANFSIDDVSAKPGETVTVTVNLDNNPGVVGAMLGITYDSSKLTYKGAKAGEALSSLTLTPPGPKAEPGYVKLLWDGLEPDVTNGSIATLRFEVNANAQDGACELELDVNNLVDSDFNDVPSASKGGKITIAK